MRLRLVAKNALSLEQLTYLDARLAALAHEGDGGSPRVWNTYESFRYALVDEALNLPGRDS